MEREGARQRDTESERERASEREILRVRERESKRERDTESVGEREKPQPQNTGTSHPISKPTATAEHDYTTIILHLLKIPSPPLQTHTFTLCVTPP